MQCLEVSCAVRRIYTSLGAKGLIIGNTTGMPHLKITFPEFTICFLPQSVIKKIWATISSSVLVKRVKSDTRKTKLAYIQGAPGWVQTVTYESKAPIGKSAARVYELSLYFKSMKFEAKSKNGPWDPMG